MMPRGRFSPHPVRLVDGVQWKWCPQCQRDRNIDAGEFGRRVSPSTGKRVWATICKDCNAANHRAYIAAQDDAYREREANRLRALRRKKKDGDGR
jgi:hypothetical protein